MIKRLQLLPLISFFLLVFLGFDVEAAIRYVREGGSGNKNGNSWANASDSFQNMINISSNGDQVWVASGTYVVSAGSGFNMKEGVVIYGGFPVTGNPSMLERDWLNNETILSGNGQSSVIYNHRVFITPLTRMAILDGFTLANGNFSRGGAINNVGCSPTLRNLRIVGNKATWGGAIYNAENSSPAIINTIIHRNRAQYHSGGIFNSGGNIELTNVVVTANRAGDSRQPGVPNRFGGAIHNSDGAILTLTNVTVAYNESEESEGKGVIHNTNNSTISVRNSIIYGNNTGLYNEDGSSIHVSYSLVQGFSSTDNGNIDGNTDPLFASPYTGCVRLLEGSPVIDKGSNTYYVSNQVPNLFEIQVDIVNEPRFYNTGTVDMGAYEFQENEIMVCDELSKIGIHPDVNGIIYVKQNASGKGDGSSWSNATDQLQDAINTPTVQQVWVAAGLYELSAHLGMKNRVSILGGFPNTGEPDILRRNGIENETILSGKNERQIIYNDPIMMLEKIDRTAVLDGFILANGYANSSGGAIRNEQSSPTLCNLRIVNNRSTWGGGILNANNSSPAIINCIIYKNVAKYHGGGVYNSGGNVEMTNVVIAGNKSSIGQNLGGGAIYNDNGANVTITNATIYGNESATLAGRGTVHNIENSNLTIRNSIIYGNNTGVYTEEGAVMSISYSLVQGLNITENGNINGNTDPLFVAPDAGCFRLKEGSSVINKGNNIYYTNDQIPDLSALHTDLGGSLRIFDETVDIGAYEYQGEDVVQCVEIPLMGMRPDENGIIYVKTTATGETDGSSWENATDNLQQAINTFGVKQVWVAEGVYYAHLSGVYGGFQMKSSVVMYGGFPTSGSPNMEQRNWKTNETILSGNHTNGIMYNDKITGAEIDGFIFRDGNVVASRGGAISNSNTSLKLRNLMITDNIADSGGAIYNNESSVEMSDVTIVDNKATSGWGGGIYHINGSLKLMRTTISGNKSGRYGGGLYFSGSNTTLEQCRIEDNEAELSPSGSSGGGIYSGNSQLFIKNTLIKGNKANIGGGVWTVGQGKTEVVNATFYQNMATSGGAALASGNEVSVKVYNSIIYDNVGSKAVYNSQNTVSPGYAEFKYSIIQDAYLGSVWESNYGTDGGGNKDEDPLFADVENGEYRLKEGSPAINTGNNSLYTSVGGDLGNDKDLAGKNRLSGVNVDMGAYEMLNLPPSVSDVSIAGNFRVWQSLTAIFNYADPEEDMMDTTKSVIRWYVSFDAEGNSSFQINTGLNYTLQDYTEGAYIAVEVTPNDGSQEGNTLRSQWIGPVLSADSTIRYVRQGGAGDESGTNWENASSDLQAMIDISAPRGVDQIWVAKGVYKPVRRADNLKIKTPGNRNNAFVVNKDVKIYGGFDPDNGIENLSHQRILPNAGVEGTILSGDLDSNDSVDGVIIGNNAYHVVINIAGQDDFTDAMLDGFTIQGGLADGNEIIDINGNNIAANHGGGLYYAVSKMVLSNIDIIGNKAKNGGGIYAQNYSYPRLVNVNISGNEAINQGGGVFSEQAGLQFVNSLISGNVAETGGGMAGIEGYHTYLNSTIASNKATLSGGGIYFDANSYYGLYNTILWDNSSGIEGGILLGATNNIIQGGLAGVNNIDIDPLFLKAPSYEIAPFVKGDYRLQTGSPAIDAGDNDLYISYGLEPEGIDLAGNPRVLNYSNNGIIDLGAYEGDWGTLPVSLISFTAEIEEERTKLQWRTSLEKDNQKFIIYRSGDDKQFIQIAEITGNLDVSLVSNYQFYDHKPLIGNNFYRLVQVDLNGRMTHLGERLVNFLFPIFGIQVYPNPTDNVINIAFETDKYTILTIADLNGKVLQRRYIQPDESSLTVSIGYYPAGIYLLSLTGGGGTETRKIVKK